MQLRPARCRAKRLTMRKCDFKSTVCVVSVAFLAMFEVFHSIYKRCEWGPGSGRGSLPGGLGPYYRFLQKVLNEKRPTSVVDLGCGFFFPYARLDWRKIRYLGIDVAEQCIAANNVYTSESRQFMRADWCNMENLPDADLAICKDVLQHWSDAEIRKGLSRLSKYSLVLVTNSISYGKKRSNSSILTGNFRPLNLMIDPYSLRSVDSETYNVVTSPIPDTKLIMLWSPQLCPYRERRMDR